jgi:hypothetical protein
VLTGRNTRAGLGSLSPPGHFILVYRRLTGICVDYVCTLRARLVDVNSPNASETSTAWRVRAEELQKEATTREAEAASEHQKLMEKLWDAELGVLAHLLLPIPISAFCSSSRS